MSHFKNKVAIITGSSMGIGKATALELARRGAKIVINGRNKERLERTKQNMVDRGFEVLAIPGDVSSFQFCQRMIQETVEKFGKIDILVNNAGMSSRGNIKDTDLEVFRKVMEINFFGQVNTIKSALPHVKETKGSIVLISSLSGIKGLPESSVYCASKMALTSLAESLRFELSGSGVHVGLVYMGITMNEPEKRVINEKGELIPLTDRSSRNVLSLEKAARLIVNSIRKRKFKSVFTWMGKIHVFANKFFPSLEDYVLIKSRKIITRMHE